MSGIQTLIPVGLTFVVLGLILGFGGIITESVKDTAETDYGNDSIAYGVLDETGSALTVLGSWQGKIAIIVVGVIIISLLMGGFGSLFQGGSI